MKLVDSKFVKERKLCMKLNFEKNMQDEQKIYFGGDGKQQPVVEPGNDIALTTVTLCKISLTSSKFLYDL